MAALPTQIDALELTTFEIEPNGTSVHLHVRDRHGLPAVVVFPLESLNQLLMTLPKIIRDALRKSHGDSFRVVYPLEHHEVELGETNTDGTSQFILSLQTRGGFAVSFVASADVMSEVARSISGYVSADPPRVARAARLS